MWLALCDCHDWGTGELQLALRNDQYSLQIRCERKFVEALQLVPMPKGMKLLTGGEFAHSASQSGSLLWGMISKRAVALTTVDAKSAWSFFVRGEALLQLSFAFDEGGSLTPLVGMDVEVMAGVIKLISRSMNSRQLLAVAVYITVGQGATLTGRCCSLATLGLSTTTRRAITRARRRTTGCAGYSSQVTCEGISSRSPAPIFRV
jgi:hypothetical protein